MSEVGYTAGPWIYQEWECDPRFNSDGNRYWGIKPEKFHTGAEYLEASGWMTEANARLIAGAPTYHELAEDAVPILEAVLEDRENANGEECEVLRDLIDRFRAAIARAEGR